MRFSPLVIITTLAAGLATAAPAPAHPADLIARNATATLTHETVIVVSLHTSKDKWSHLPIKTQTDCRVIDLDGHVTDVIILFGYRCKFWSSKRCNGKNTGDVLSGRLPTAGMRDKAVDSFKCYVGSHK